VLRGGVRGFLRCRLRGRLVVIVVTGRTRRLVVVVVVRRLFAAALVVFLVGAAFFFAVGFLAGESESESSESVGLSAAGLDGVAAGFDPRGLNAWAWAVLATSRPPKTIARRRITGSSHNAEADRADRASQGYYGA